MKQLEIGAVTATADRPLIAAPITANTWQQAVQQASLLKESAVDVAEWRVDYLGALDNLMVTHIQKVCQAVNKPVIFTWRTQAEGGQKTYRKQTYENVYLNAISAGVAALDIEISLLADQKNLLQKIPNDVQIIGSKHYFTKTPTNLVPLLEKMDTLPIDIVKLAVMPQQLSDVAALLTSTKKVAKDAKKPLITMAMGTMGIPSRIIGREYGSQLTFATVISSSAPGQLLLTDLLQKWGTSYDI
ncbi:type I 3-dehydroquinate dehydratase [Weissella sagaensis]|uniref:3-dehydroquinate dehydratase n=1 Tax=Weissella sagaensis TaxID=2559928 RepID=A0ABW1RRY4_9LACO|nr:type I 3-dehydroquinate dehydratase [Weissella sagaensis]MBU7568418.1 type I 3-dehydroquinate dehydratase [Weissella hellenica]QEA57518.1 type I 3-dehydroquinate dehydratase [Weissella hellenica]UEG66680.1 type I 3-dehydroquinate dehydratase [Weissella hellenica]